MTLADLRKFSRLYVSKLKGGKLESIELDVIIKAGVKLIAQEIECLTAYSNFNAAEDVGEYKISVVATDYAKVQESGLWWNSGTVDDPDWKRLKPVSRAYLDKYSTNWRDAGSGSPEEYYIEGDIIGVYPKPADALVNGFRLHYFRFPQEMVQDTDYAFEDGVSIPHLQVLDDCIFAYVKWKSSPIVGDNQMENPYEAEFYRELSRKYTLIHSRKDISNYTGTNRNKVKFRGPRL